MGKLKISSSAGAQGSSYTNWENFESLVDGWKNLGAIISVAEEKHKRPVYVIASFPDGVCKKAWYNPSFNELNVTEIN